MQAIGELVAEYGRAALPMVPKVLIGRVLFGLPIDHIVGFDLHNRSLRTWPRYAATMRLAAFFRFVNNEHGGADFFRDKVLSAERCVQRGVPILSISAVAARTAPMPAAFRALGDIDAVADFIAGPDMPASAFIKPAGGMGGAGAFAARRSDAGWSVEGAILSDGELARKIVSNGDGKGFLIQPAFRAAAEMSPAGGVFGLPTLRVQTALTRAGPRVLYIVQKILGGKMTVDNFSGGAKGNLIAAVDPATGELGMAYGRAANRKHVLSRHAVHPRTGERISGARLPRIAEIVDVAHRIAAAFPESPLVGSDIAVTEDGVHVVEINNSPDQMLAQIACGRGVADIYRDIIPELSLPDAQLEKAKALFAACVNKRWKTVRFA